MHTTVRRCTNCGRGDMRVQWESVDAAFKTEAMTTAWSCPFCSWSEAELVQVPAGAARVPVERGSPPDPDVPAGHKAARRQVETLLPFHR